MVAYKEPGTWKHRDNYGTGGACFGYCPWRDEKCNDCLKQEWKKVARDAMQTKSVIHPKG